MDSKFGIHLSFCKALVPRLIEHGIAERMSDVIKLFDYNLQREDYISWFYLYYILHIVLKCMYINNIYKYIYFIPQHVKNEAQQQEPLIQVTGLEVGDTFTMMNLAFCAYDKKETGIVSKEVVYFVLRMFNMQKGQVPYAIARCDHNTTQRDIAYVEFIKELQAAGFGGTDNFSKTFGPQPRSPHRNIKAPVRNLGDSTMAGFGLDDTMNDLLQ